MKSLRFRFALAVLTGQLVLLGVATAVAYEIGTRTVTQQFDEAFVAQAETMASLLEQEGRKVWIDRDEAFMQPFFPGEDAEYLQLYYEETSFARSPSLGEDDLTLRFGTLEEPETWNEALPDGRAGRFIGIEVTVPEDEVEPDDETGEVVAPARVRIVLAKSRENLDRLSSLLLYGLLGGDLLLLLCGLAVMWGTVTLSLGPVRAFARKVEAVDVHTLSVPLDPAQVPSELGPVVTGVNDLLGRLDSALKAERRAASNMAHELMTPISELRALSEIALQDESDAAYRLRALGLAHDISHQMANLIKMVRQLTLVEARSEVLPGEPIPIAAVVERVVAAFRERARVKRLDVDVDVNGEVIECNRDALLSVCNNLLGNAVEYTPEGGRIELRSAASGSRVSLQIANECEDLGAEHLPHLTEPFWRLSASRSEVEHHGLGLTIAHGMATLAGIELRFDIGDGRFVAEATAPARDATRA